MDNFHKPMVLVIDDDPNFHDIVRHILADQGYTVRCIADPEELNIRRDFANPCAIL
ncbi:MAG: hypothetical protein ABGX16_14340 [Pirellulales bacterium]